MKPIPVRCVMCHWMLSLSKAVSPMMTPAERNGQAHIKPLRLNDFVALVNPSLGRSLFISRRSTVIRDTLNDRFNENVANPMGSRVRPC